jgi:hypothetical protein
LQHNFPRLLFLAFMGEVVVSDHSTRILKKHHILIDIHQMFLSY